MASISTCINSNKSPISKPSLLGRSPRVPAFIRLRTSQRFADVRVRVSVPAIKASLDIHAGIRPGSEVETDKLPSDVRNRAMEAVDSFGGRVTIGDVVSRAGLNLNEAEKALQDLAADTGGFLEIGQYIASKGGVVTAEELAPYLDVMPTNETTEQDDDSYVLPVLLCFDGHPEVDDEGNILYFFPSLQRTASSQGGRKEYVGKK